MSDNQAVGDRTVTVSVNAVFNAVGGAFGGGVANFGRLTVTGCTLIGNQARGADNADSSGSSFPGPAFAGNALGGGLANFATASVAGSLFTQNTSRAGSGGRGDFAAIGGGGAILNDADMTITASAFRHNQALGGSNAVSPFHNGHSLGGAVMTGSLLPAAGGPGATITVTASTFDHNQSFGGNDNQVTLPLNQVPPGDGPNNGYGGDILVYQGSAAIRLSTVTDNRAVGGAGGAEQNGSLGVGGGVFFFNFLGGVTGTVEDSVIAHNEAIGGRGRAGGADGDGLGGGVTAGGLGSPFSAPGAVAISSSVIADNLARGGDGGPGGAGGDGLGGGVYNGADSTMTVTASVITLNEARGGPGTGSGSAGVGRGGGVYNLGTISLAAALVLANDASTSDDNCFGC